MTMMDELRMAALGEIECDMVIRDGELFLPTCEFVKGDVAVHKGVIVGLFDDYEGKVEVDADGMWVSPGFIDAHLHVESTCLTLCEFSKLAVPRGTTTVVCDPHEVANVSGIFGISELMMEAKGLPLSVFFTIPSCVPASPFETGGAELGLKEVKQLLCCDEVVALGEVMNFPALVGGDKKLMDKVQTAHRVDGHAPLLGGKELSAYILLGPKSDHECTTSDEALEKLRKGMWVMVREGSSAKNLDILEGILDEGLSLSRCMLVSDDRDPRDLKKGYFDEILKRVVEMGVEPGDALSMITTNPANYFRIDGHLEVGARADLVMLSEDFCVHEVIKDGKVVAEDGKLIVSPKKYSFDESLKKSINVPVLDEDMFKVRVDLDGEVCVRVIGVREGSLITESLRYPLSVENGEIMEDVDRDVLRIAVIERHKGSGRVALGFIHGFGLQSGAFGSSVAHDSHNIVVVGVNPRDMMRVVDRIHQMQGGWVVCDGDEVASLRLEICGLMTASPYEEVVKGIERIESELMERGVEISSPFMTLSFVSLSPIPHLKLTDMGLVEDFTPVPLVLGGCSDA